LAQSLPRIQARVSAIYGEHDALYRGCLPELQAAMSSLPPDWGRWQTVAEAGHWVPYETAESFNCSLLNILGGTPSCLNKLTSPFE
jgi:pimeloyl-ACP methyl ester carboxylesterase